MRTRQALAAIALVGACQLDPDEDGLIRREERAIGSDVREADTDGDGLDDGDEAGRGTDPLDDDSDDDGVLDGDELAAGTDPLDADSDDDAVLDGDELAAGTDPLDDDSDDDTIRDGDEPAFGTDPLDDDSDDDGLTDAEDHDLGADPLDPDTDDDHLLDGEEVEAGTRLLHPDSDLDGYLDGDEVLAGTDPLDATSLIYEGGWPFRRDKGDLTPPPEGATLTVGARLPRWNLPDQGGQLVDVYDLAGRRSPVVLVLGDTSPASATLADQARGATPADVGAEGLAAAIDEGRLVWAHLVVWGVDRAPATVDEHRAWYAAHPDGDVPVLGDAAGEVGLWATGAPSAPWIVVCDADLVVQRVGAAADVLPEFLATL